MARTFSLSTHIILLILLVAGISNRGWAMPDEEQSGWPKKIETKNGDIIIYQPQTESYSGDMLEARAAVSVTKPGLSPVFGAMWFECRVSTDRDERIVELVDLKVSAAKFPETSQADVEELSSFLETEIPKFNIQLSLDRLLASLEMDEGGSGAAPDYNNEAPEIIYSTKPAVLVYVDGDPILKDSEISNLQYVVNTPFFIAKDIKSETYYIKGGEHWFSSKDPKSGWENIDNPPKNVVKLAEENMPEEEGETEDPEVQNETDVVPEIIVRTTPAELLLSNGDAEYIPIGETTLLYMSNTDADIIMDIATQHYYILLAGRWYTSSSLTNNDWTYLKPTDLPEEFKNIPSESAMASVKSSVSGTQEAREAVLENQIPQTAEVSREDATVEVTYDGDPQFDYIEETTMKYGVNTDKSVLLINNKYYCCDNAIWFVSGSATGPWEVCVEVPAEVQNIPPESPVYNVKYVYVYDYSPTIVYVGYTPGYVYSYSYMGCVYYGTGYYYRPWYHTYYYPRPVTYGFGVHYNPYSGWGFSATASRGWFSVSVHSGGYWGPSGYRHGYNHGYHNGYRHGYNRGAAAGYRAGYNQGQRNAASNNVYNKRQNGVARTGNKSYNPKTGQQLSRDTRQNNATRQTPQKGKGANNVYTDKNGKVYKRDGDKWKTQENGKWKDAAASDRSKSDRSNNQNRDVFREPDQKVDRSNKSTTRQQSNQNVGRPAQQASNFDNLNRDAQNRNRGNQRSNNYQQNRSNYQYQQSPSRSRPGGGGGRPSGGGGRGRK